MLPREIIKKVRRIEIHTSHIVDELLSGSWNSAFKGRGIEFEEVRPYQYRRRRPDNRLERHRPHRPTVRQAFPRRARTVGHAAGRPQCIAKSRHPLANEARTRHRTQCNARLLGHQRQRQSRAHALHRRHREIRPAAQRQAARAADHSRTAVLRSDRAGDQPPQRHSTTSIALPRVARSFS